jgi:recombination protein RecA
LARKQTLGRAAAQVAARVNAQMKGEVVLLGTDPRFQISRVPTGILTIDRLTGGGFARGRHHLLYGDWQAGKSLVTYTTMALAQARGEVCAVVDGEHVFDGEWFDFVGGRSRDLILYQPKNANELGNVLRLFVQKDPEVKGVDIVSVDSVASLAPLEEMDHDFEEGDARVGSLARLMSLLLRKVTTENDDTTFLWVNQWRDKISRIPGLKSTPGGHALGFYASTSIEMMLDAKETEARDVALKGSFSQRKVAIGRWVNLRVMKEKTGARPEATASFMFDFEKRQVDRAREVIDLGLADGFITKRGEYFIYTTLEGVEVKAHGGKRFRTKLEGDEELMDELVTLIEEQTAAMMVVEDG